MEELKKWLFRTKDGDFVTFQRPNLAIILAAAGYGVSYLSGGDLANAFEFVGRAALIFWALMELIQGVNNSRKLLGVLGLLLAVISV